MDGLEVHDLNLDLDLTPGVGKFHGVGQEVDQDLQHPSLVSQDLLDHAEVLAVAYFCRQLQLILVSQMGQHFKCLLNRKAQVEKLVADIKGVVLHFGQVEQIIDEILDHALRENLALQVVLGLLDGFADL